MTDLVEAAATGSLGAAVSAPSITPESAPAPAPAPAEAVYEFPPDFQAKITALLLRDPVFTQRTDGLIKPEYFENQHDQAITRIVLDHYARYKSVPDRFSLSTVLKEALDSKKIRKDMVPGIGERLKFLFRVPVSDRDFAIEKIAQFARNQAVQAALLESANLLSSGNFEKIERLMRQALDVGAHEDDSADYDYWSEIDNRTEFRKDLAEGKIKPDGITTGYPEIDAELYHGGWGRRELSAIMGRAKFGKSMGLGDFGKNAALAGYNVFIASCEVSTRIYSDRIDANLSDTMMKELKKTPFAVRDKIKEYLKKPRGVIKIRDFPSGMLKPSQLRRILQRYRSRGIIFDLIIVDYADIMCPEKVTGEPTQDHKSIWVDLRAIAHEENAAVLTATQTNRDGAKAVVAGGTHVAEDYNKVRIADLLISGNATEDEIKAGEMRLFFAASRNQEGEFTIRVRQDRSRMKFITKVIGREK